MLDGMGYWGKERQGTSSWEAVTSEEEKGERFTYSIISVESESDI